MGWAGANIWEGANRVGKSFGAKNATNAGGSRTASLPRYRLQKRERTAGNSGRNSPEFGKFSRRTPLNRRRGRRGVRSGWLGSRGGGCRFRPVAPLARAGDIHLLPIFGDRATSDDEPLFLQLLHQLI